MNITIKQNDYVQPTEVRENIVQSICDVLITMLDTNLTLTVHVKHAELYVGKNAIETIITRSTLCKKYEYTRVHSTEVDEAFKAFQDAGYHIYMIRDKKTKDTTYRFSKKPVLEGMQSKNIEFDMFID